MPETMTTRGLSPADFALMRAIVRWRREQESATDRIEFSTHRGWGGYLTWEFASRPLRGGDKRQLAVEVAYDGSDDFPRQLRMVVSRRDLCDQSVQEVEIEPASVREAVDLLVAFGFLPARFSSAYRAGWDARHDAATVACRNGMGSPGMDSAEVRALEPAVSR